MAPRPAPSKKAQAARKASPKTAPARKAPAKKRTPAKAAPVAKKPAKRPTGRARTKAAKTPAKIVHPPGEEPGHDLTDEQVAWQYLHRFPLSRSVIAFIESRTGDDDWSLRHQAIADAALRLAAELDAGAGMAAAAISKELRLTLADLSPEDADGDDLEFLNDAGVPV